MITQKTWTQLLGPYTTDTRVFRKYIVRNIFDAEGKTTYRVLWAFDNNDKAKTAYQYWKEGK